MNNNIHKIYLKKEDQKIENEIEEERKGRKISKVILEHGTILILAGISLFIISEALGNTLESLCNSFNVPQLVVGILLGVITSMPELITFFESQKHNKNANNDMLGVVEATNNLLTSNMLNLFVIQTIGIIILNII